MDDEFPPGDDMLDGVTVQPPSAPEGEFAAQTTPEPGLPVPLVLEPVFTGQEPKPGGAPPGQGDDGLVAGESARAAGAACPASSAVASTTNTSSLIRAAALENTDIFNVP